jgi:DNA-binding CsgD family transcriptional regulator
MVFYLCLKLFVSYEARVFAGELANTPPVWTAEQGLSAAFVQKYELSPQERETAETMLLGKNDKEIAQKLNISVNTVQAHLKKRLPEDRSRRTFCPLRPGSGVKTGL